MSNLVATIQSFTIAAILAASSSTSKANKLPSLPIAPSLPEFLSNSPIFEWIGWLCAVFFVVFVAVSSTTGKLAALIGNLQKIIDFRQKNLLRKQVEVSETKLLQKRKQILNRLKDDILKRSKKSLLGSIKIDLEIEEQPHQVGIRTWEISPQDAKNSIPLNPLSWFSDRSNSQNIIDFFDRPDIQGKLLILGEPGGGKTTELLCLTQVLIQRAIDKNDPIPIIFEISTWKDKQSIRDWLIEQLCNIYKAIPKEVAEHWIDNQEIIPLLDGLNELKRDRDNFISKLREFLETSFQPGLVVCCQREEYERVQNKLEQLNSAIYLKPLSDDRLRQYLNRSEHLRIWDEIIVNNRSLLDLVRKPLFLNMLVFANRVFPIRKESELFEAYIDEQFERVNHLVRRDKYSLRKIPSRKQTLHYLVWLAKKLEAKGEPEFLIEELQPDWLDSKQRVYYRLIAGISVGLITTSLTLGLITNLTVELWGWLLGLMFGILFGLFAGLAKIEPVEKLDFDFKKIRNNWVIGMIALIVGLNLGLIIGLLVGEILGWIFGLGFGLIWWLVFSLSIWLSGGLHSRKIETHKKQLS